MLNFKNTTDFTLNWKKHKDTEIGVGDFPMKTVKEFKNKVDFALNLGKFTPNPFPERKKE